MKFLGFLLMFTLSWVLADNIELSDLNSRLLLTGIEIEMTNLQQKTPSQTTYAE